MKFKKIFLVFFLTLFVSASFSFAENIEKTVFPNGLVVITKENPTSQIVAIEIFIKNTLFYENEKNSGITNLLQNLLLKGTKKRNQEKISEEIDLIGGKIDISTSPDYSSISLVIPSLFLKEGLEILTDILLNPGFPEEEIEKTKKEIIQQIKKEEDEIFTKTYRTFLKNLYQNHPYARKEVGEEEIVKNITREEIVKFYNQIYVPNNMVISICGNFKKEEVIKELEKYFLNIPRKELPEIQSFKTPQLLSSQELFIKKETAAYWVMLGFLVEGIRDRKEYVALKVLDSLLGSGMSSLLFTNLRDKLGLAYEIGSFYPTRKDTSHFVLYAITSSKISRIKSAFLFEISRLKYITFTPQDLERAKKYLIGTFLLEHEENKKQAFYLGFYEILGLGYQFDKEYVEEIRRVNLSTLKKVVQKYFNHYILVATGEVEEPE